MTVEDAINGTIRTVWFVKGERRNHMFGENTLMYLPDKNSNELEPLGAMLDAAREQADQQSYI